MSSCGVCTAPLSALGGGLAACPSGDIFHESCINKWVASRGQCCTCKQRLTQQQLVSLKLPHNDTAALTAQSANRKLTTAPTTPQSASHKAAVMAASAPTSPTLPPAGSPLSLAHVEELVTSYRRTATSYQQNRQLLQSKLNRQLQQLQLAYSRVITESSAVKYETSEEADEALMHRHMLMAKLLACVHEARLRDEEDSVDETARVVRRVTGSDEVTDDSGVSVTGVVRVMEQLMEAADAECWERIRTKRQQLVDMEEEMRREASEKQQRTQRIAALEERRLQLEDSMHTAAPSSSRKRKHSPSPSPPFLDHLSPAAAENSPLRLLSTASYVSSTPKSRGYVNGGDNLDDSQMHGSPSHSSTPYSSAALSALKRTKHSSYLPRVPPPPITTEQFNAMTDVEKLHLPRLTILQHCPTIESFLSHELHLRTLKRHWPDNEWRKINTTYTGQRKRKGLKGRGRGRQVLPATLEEQQVWKDVRKREMELLTGAPVTREGDDGSVGDNGNGGSGSGGLFGDESDDDESSEDAYEMNEGVEGKGVSGDDRSDNGEPTTKREEPLADTAGIALPAQ